MLDNEGLEMLDTNAAGGSNSSAVAAIREAVEVVEVVKLRPPLSAGGGGVFTGNEICIIEKFCSELGELESTTADATAIIVVDCLDQNNIEPVTDATILSSSAGAGQRRASVGNSMKKIDASTSSSPGSRKVVSCRRDDTRESNQRGNDSDTASEYIEV